MPKTSDYTYIMATILFTVYGQLILKWRIAKLGTLPEGYFEKFRFLFSVFTDPLILTGFVAAFAASFAWMAAMTKFELSHAYPFMSLNFVIVSVLSVWLLDEPITFSKLAGGVLIVLGTVVIARG